MSDRLMAVPNSLSAHWRCTNLFPPNGGGMTWKTARVCSMMHIEPCTNTLVGVRACLQVIEWPWRSASWRISITVVVVCVAMSAMEESGLEDIHSGVCIRVLPYQVL